MRSFTKVAVATAAAGLLLSSAGIATAQGLDTGSLGSTGTPEPTGPKVVLSKSANITAAGETITATGTDFSGANFGIYVGLVQDNKFSATDASAWMSTKWVKQTDITGGAWQVELPVSAVANGSNCLVNACSIYTVSAHGVDDPSQTTKTPVTFQ